MRIDHHAYQRGTQVAFFGLLVQFAIAMTLLIFGVMAGDSALTMASWYVFAGTLVWLSLIVIFHQHRLERLEALEEDELAAAREGNSSIFDASAEEQRVAARRLALMHKWMMPAASLLIAGLLGLLAFLTFRFMRLLGAPPEDGGRDFAYTDHVGWAVAICLSIALISFIFSRFVAGMAKQEVWQNLRGGAAYMVGNTLVMLAIAAGLIFRVFGNDDVIIGITYAVAVFMGLQALEIALNFILNVYRPRIPGETPRPAFDSRVLSLLAAPDSIVKSINEAVNYQFGFDITSSWGYQLLLRSFVWLIALGVGVLILLNMMVVVEPHQQAIRLQHGAIVGDVHGSGVMWKWPWPINTAQIHDVSRIRELDLTARRLRPDIPVRQQIHRWDHALRMEDVDRELRPFLVGASVALDEEDFEEFDLFIPEDLILAAEDVEEAVEQLERLAEEDEVAAEEVIEMVSQVFALVDAEISLRYRVRDDGGDDLLNYLKFVSDDRRPRATITERERAIRNIALREITQQFSRMTLDEVLSEGQAGLAEMLRERIQQACDRIPAGVEIVSVQVPMVRPSGQVAGEFEELIASIQARRTRVARAERDMTTMLMASVGDPDIAARVLDRLEELEAIRDEFGVDSAEAVAKRERIEQMLVKAGGEAAVWIRQAETERWVELMKARARSNRVRSELLAYRASPAIYEQREIMQILVNTLRNVRKYIIGIDPRQINIGVDLKELSPVVDFGLALPDEERE